MKSVKNVVLSFFVLFFVIFVQFASPTSARAACSGVVYVDADSTAASPTGCSWAQAYPTLQGALATLANGTFASEDQIWVAEGIYYPDDGLVTLPSDIRDSTFRLYKSVDGVEFKIYGGFNGTETEAEFNQRNPSTNITILSGDINGTTGNTGDNAYHVITISPQATSATVLDGFTITDGNTEGDGHFGGGVYIVNASPTLENLVISNNQSPTGGGGGMYISTDPAEPVSSPTLTNMTFSNNIAERGGGLFNQNSNPILNNVKFIGNSATNGAGGGMNSQTANPGDAPSNPVLTNVTFSGNVATGGGGMINSNSHAVMTNVTFSGNTASRRGGGLINEDSNPELRNVTFYNNISNDNLADPRGGGGMININSDPVINNITFSANNSVLIGGDAMRNVNTSAPTISNGIFWGDIDDEIANDGTSVVTIKDSVVEGGITGTHIITTDPKLESLASNGGFTQTMALGVDSSAIDEGGVNAACESTDQRGITRPQGTACDIGAYEFDGATILIVSPVTDIYGNTVSLTATLESYGTGLSGKTINFTLNGSSVGNIATNSSGVATLNSVSLVGIDAGVYTGGAGSGVGASFAGDTIFDAANDTDTLIVNQRLITVTAVADSKVYDGTVNSTGEPSITSGSLASGDTASWAQSFNTKNVGTNKILTPTGNVSDSNGGGNYSITFTSVSTGAITAKVLTVSGITAGNKVYDGNTTATLNVAGAVLNGVVGTENVTLNTGSAAGEFDSKNAGTDKTVTVSGLILGGTDVSNYSLTQPTTTANITVKGLTVSGITAGNKVYDGNTTATLNVAGAVLNGVVGTENVTLNTGSVAGAFDSKNAGTDKTVTVSGLILGGTDVGNYSLTQPTTTANITVKGLTVSGITAGNKVYDGNTTATLNVAGAVLNGVVGTENVTLNTGSVAGAFDSKNAGTDKTVTVSSLTLGGTDVGNYSLTQPTTTANITVKGLTVSGITAGNKVYDGNTTATLNVAGAVLNGVVGTENVTLNTGSAAGEFDSKNAGTDKTVTVSGLILGGTDVNNYSLTQPTTTANITVKGLTVSGITAGNKVYDGNTTATLNVAGAVLNGVVGTENVTLNIDSAAGEFDSKNAGTDKTVTVSGLILGGTDVSNYSLTQPTTTANITVKGLTVSGITAGNKVYDGNTTATLNVAGAVLNGVVGTENVTLNTGSVAGAFDSKNAGTDKTVTVSSLTLGGTDVGNYSLTQPTTTANITVKGLTVSGITAGNKVYDGNTTATLNVAGAVLNGVVGTENVTLNTGSVAGAFDSKNAGIDKTVTVSSLTLGGTDVGNYSLTQPSTTANITKRLLSVTASGIDKNYDGTVTANVTLSDNRVPGDILTITFSTALFLDPNIGNGKTINVSDISLDGGIDSGNYTLANTTASTTANILQANQTITITTSAPSSATNGSDFTVVANASSGLPVTYISTTPGICSNNGATFTMISGTGTCVVQYTQIGNTNYLPAPELKENVTATEDPSITSADNTTFNVGELGAFTVTVLGNPPPSLSVAGILPTGVTFTPLTGVLSGTPALGTDGTYNITFTASNGVGPDATQTFILTVTSLANINVTVGVNPMGSYTLASGKEKRESYPVSGGPVIVKSTNGMDIVSAIRLQSFASNTLYSFVETMGVPEGLLSHKYYFPTYNNTWGPLNSQVRFGNLNDTATTIRVTIGGVNVWEESVPGLEERRLYFNVSGGPVVIESLDPAKKIVAAIRLQSMTPSGTLYSFAETMGIPDEELSHKYYFPTYNNTWGPLNSQVRFGNLNDTATTIRVTIGGVNVWEESVPGLEERRLYFNVSGGPVVIESLDPTKKIVAAIRLQSMTAEGTLYSFVETMGVPEGLLSHKYYFPTYDNTWGPLNSQIRFGNLDATQTRIRVTIGGNIVWEDDVPGLEERRLYFNVSGGPVKVESLDPAKKIVAAIRLQSMTPSGTLYSFAETMGVPDEQLSGTYYFPTYNNTWGPLNSQLRFGVP